MIAQKVLCGGPLLRNRSRAAIVRSNERHAELVDRRLEIVALSSLVFRSGPLTDWQASCLGTAMRDRTDKTNPTMKVIIAAGTTRALVRRAKQCESVRRFAN